MKVFVIVFEDNQLELIDADKIYTSKEVAEGVKDSYQRAYYSDGSRKLIVRPMNMDTRKNLAAA